MKVLVVGSGGREHALVWRLAQSPLVSEIFVAPGNPGTQSEPKTKNVPIPAMELEHLKSFALTQGIDLTIVGPEAPLVAGLVDLFTQAGLKCFGPNQYCAQLEGSKAFAKAFLHRHHIPTASYAVFDDVEKALLYIASRPLPIVIKADGLAAGKGVVIAKTYLEAKEAVENILGKRQFGAAGASIVVEDFLVGSEASFIVMSDGKNVLPFPSAQDHKARDEGDQGPNTGGMGAYSPAPVITSLIHQKVMDTIIYPTLAGMAEEGHPFVGFLYAGLMVGANGSCQVLEFNCRLGDPETQPLMMRLNSCLATLCLAALEGKLDPTLCEWDKRPALGVVLASRGYPDTYPTGEIIEGLEKLIPSTEHKIFHAGTTLNNGKIVTAGGRVLSAVALGNTLKDAQNNAYTLAETVSWPSMYYRRDIGFKAL